jgi:hypothetical protein
VCGRLGRCIVYSKVANLLYVQNTDCRLNGCSVVNSGFGARCGRGRAADDSAGGNEVVPLGQVVDEVLSLWLDDGGPELSRL